jgi:hypothetical protein
MRSQSNYRRLKGIIEFLPTRETDVTEMHDIFQDRLTSTERGRSFRSVSMAILDFMKISCIMIVFN